MEIVHLALAACMAASPLSAQRIAELATGPNRHVVRTPVRDSDSTRTSDASAVQGGLIGDIVRNGGESAPFSGIPLHAPKRRCEDIGPFVTAFVLGTLAMSYVLSVLLPGGRSFGTVVIPIVAVAAVGIGVAAAICNR